MTHARTHTVTATTVPVEAGELFCESAGEGPPVVLLHGGMLDLNMWNEQFSWLAGLGYRVIRYDARGHGRSSTVAGDYANHDDLHALLTRLDVPCATLVGLSLGARTALDTAIAHPESVSALVLASPGVSGRPFADPYVAHHTAQQMAAAGDPDGGAQRFVEHFLRMWVDGPYREPSQVSRTLRERMHASASANVMRHAAGWGRGCREKSVRRTGWPPSACPPWFSTENSTAVTFRQTLRPSPEPFPAPGANGSPRRPTWSTSRARHPSTSRSNPSSRPRLTSTEHVHPYRREHI